VVIWTSNSLALLALNFLPDAPLMHDPEQVVRIQGVERKLEDADHGSGNKIGTQVTFSHGATSSTQLV
jgi:hypothetical protein